MVTRHLFRRSLVAVILTLASAAAAPLLAAEPYESSRMIAGAPGTTQFMPLGVGKSLVIDLPRDAKDVLVANPQIANAIMRSARRAYLIGVKVGQTNVFFFDAEGRQIAGYDIAVTRDLNGIRGALKQALPHADIKIEGIGEDSVMISGTVATPAESQLAYELAAKLVSSRNAVAGGGGGGGGGGEKDVGVVNALTIRIRDQIMLRVTVAEVQRDVIKQLGIDLNGSLKVGSSVLNFNTDNPFSATNQALSSTTISPQGPLSPNPQELLNPVDPTSGVLRSRFGATIRAMERAGVLRTLAEPNLTAISGESANFLAGGEFPIPAGYTCDPLTRVCQLGVQFKKFGIGLNFTPVVLSEGRISLKVMTEVSELSSEGALTIAQGSGNVTIPGIKTRRAETTVEIPSGGSLAMAGMIHEQTKQHINGLPGMMQLPVLGTLFKSRDYVNRQTELMILVTPYVVRAVARKELSQPDDGFVDATDPASVLLGRLNRIYGANGKSDPRGNYRGSYGYILD
jgi:pilus assembly protein CpaC